MTTPLDSVFPPEPIRSIIGHVTHSLDHLADRLGYIDEYDEIHHSLRIACTDSFLLDFRMLHNFLLGNRGQQDKGKDAHRYDFLDVRAWQPQKTDATKRMRRLADFVSKYRAHLSRSRFERPYQSLDDVLGVPKLTSEFLAHTLLNYLDVLDDFIEHLPDTRESGRRAWEGAAYNARYKTEVRLGIRTSNFPGLGGTRPGRGQGHRADRAGSGRC